jgi:predicted heme/steroid binding protein/uncharacterized membrane protein
MALKKTEGTPLRDGTPAPSKNQGFTDGLEEVMKEMTREELSSCNGKDGKPAYVAYQGKVYDVTGSRLWPKGLHMNRHASGRELTADISAAPHGTDVLDRYPQVAVLKKEPPEELKHLPLFLRDLLQRFPMARRHPHPMVVHFPIAFLMGASLSVLLDALLGHLFFKSAGYYLLILGAISSPFAMATGLLTWWINYRLKLTLFVKRKIQLSVLLLVLEIILILWSALNPEILRNGINPIWLMLMLLLTPIVGLLGYYGGQMTFPSEKE